MLYSLFPSWGSRCWDRLSLTAFATLGVPAGTGLFMHPLARLWHPCMGYNFMQPSRILSCSHHHCIIGVKKFFTSFWHLLDLREFSTSSRNGGIMRYVYIAISSLWPSWGSYYWNRFAVYSLLLRSGIRV